MRKIFFVFALALFVLPPMVQASSYSISFTDFPSSATVGQSITANVMVTNSSGTGSGTASISLTIDSTYLSKAQSEDLTKTCTFSNSNTCEVSWSLTTLKSGTKSVSAAGSSGSDTISSQSSSNVVISAPTSYGLTFTSSPSSGSALTASQSATLSLTVQNTGQSASTSVSLSLTGFTLTSGSSTVNLGTIAEGGQTTTSWTVRHDGSTAAPSASAVVTGGGDSKSSSVSFSYSAGGNNGTSTSGSGGGGGSDTSKEKKVAHKPVPPGLVNNTKLQAAIEKVLAKGKMSQNAIDNLLRLSNIISGDSDISRTISAGASKSNVTTKIKYKGAKIAKNYVVYEKVPKSFANTSDQITISVTGAKVEVVEKDPEYAIVFDTVNPNQELSIVYAVSKAVSTNAVDSFATEVYAESLSEPAAPAEPAQPTPAQTETQQEKPENTIQNIVEAQKSNILIVVLISLIVIVAGYIYFRKHREEREF